MSSQLHKLKAELNIIADHKKAKTLKWFFKTGKGEYGEGDIFLGITVPIQRQLAKKYSHLPLADISKLLKSKIHEHRLVAVLILVVKYQRTSTVKHEGIYKFYLKHAKYINNWDLVDSSADKIVGDHLHKHPSLIRTNRRIESKSVLIKLAKSQNLWERRIAVISTFHFIKQGKPEQTLTIVKMLINDTHDLIHKACGWMLREVGKRCGEKYLIDFLNRNANKMPRTMLRYSIERLSKDLKLKYLKV